MGDAREFGWTRSNSRFFGGRPGPYFPERYADPRFKETCKQLQGMACSRSRIGKLGHATYSAAAPAEIIP